MKIFIICSVRGATSDYKRTLEEYTESLELNGHTVHLPHRDTNQKGTSLEICTQNMLAIKDADEVHIFYETDSQGAHFDLGVSFGLGKKIVVVQSQPLTDGKSFQNMINEWESKN